MERYDSWEVDILQEGEGQPLLEVEEGLLQEEEVKLLQQEEEERQLDGTVQRDPIFGPSWSADSRYEEEPCIERICAVEILPRGQLCERLPLVLILGIWQGCFGVIFFGFSGIISPVIAKDTH